MPHRRTYQSIFSIASEKVCTSMVVSSIHSSGSTPVGGCSSRPTRPTRAGAAAPRARCVRAQLHRAEAHAQARLTRGTLGGAWHVQLTHFRLLLALHHFHSRPVAPARAHARSAVARTSRAGWSSRERASSKSSKTSDSPVADAHHTRMRAQALCVCGRLEAGQPLVALLVFDRPLAARVLLAKLGGIACPHLHVQKAERDATRCKGERVMDFQASAPSAALVIVPSPVVAECVL